MRSRGLDGTRCVRLYRLRASCAQMARFWRAKHRARNDRGVAAGDLQAPLPLRLIGVNAVDVLALFHIPVGTLLVCGLCALLFEERTRERVFLLFAFGMVTHYALDVLLISVTGGLVLAFPLSWEMWQLDLVRPNNWLGTTILVTVAVLMWLVLRVWRRSELEPDQNVSKT